MTATIKKTTAKNKAKRFSGSALTKRKDYRFSNFTRIVFGGLMILLLNHLIFPFFSIGNILSSQLSLVLIYLFLIYCWPFERKEKNADGDVDFFLKIYSPIFALLMFFSLFLGYIPTPKTGNVIGDSLIFLLFYSLSVFASFFSARIKKRRLRHHDEQRGWTQK